MLLEDAFCSQIWMIGSLTLCEHAPRNMPTSRESVNVNTAWDKVSQEALWCAEIRKNTSMSTTLKHGKKKAERSIEAKTININQYMNNIGDIEPCVHQQWLLVNVYEYSNNCEHVCTLEPKA